MRSLMYIKPVRDTISNSVLSNIVFIVPITETVNKMMDRAVDEYPMRNERSVENSC